jgi:hypothetical protein
MGAVQLDLCTCKNNEYGKPSPAVQRLHEGFKLEKDSGYWSALLCSNSSEAYCCLLPVSSLCKKFEKAVIGLKDTSEAYFELSAALDGKLVKSWQKDEEKAQVKKGEALRIYDVQLEQGKKLLPVYKITF